MAKDFIGYQALTDQALRGVVRDALRRIEKSGLIGAHHFYLTFKTHADGVDIPDFLKEQYPDEMTIIIQHQYWALKVKDDYFEVTLTFKKLPAPLSYPFRRADRLFRSGGAVRPAIPQRRRGQAEPPARSWCRRRPTRESPLPTPLCRPTRPRPGKSSVWTLSARNSTRAGLFPSKAP